MNEHIDVSNKREEIEPNRFQNYFFKESNKINREPKHNSPVKPVNFDVNKNEEETNFNSVMNKNKSPPVASPNYLRLTSFINELNNKIKSPPHIRGKLVNIYATEHIQNSSVNLNVQNDESSNELSATQVLEPKIPMNKKSRSHNYRNCCCFKKPIPVIVKQEKKKLSLESKKRWCMIMRKILLVNRVISALLEVKKEIGNSRDREDGPKSPTNAIKFINSFQHHSVAFSLKQNDDKNRCIILPTNKMGWVWSIILILLLIWSAIYLPYRLAFLDEVSLGYWIMELCIDIFFSFDIVISFFSAYYDKQHMLVTSKKQIAKRYLTTWFIIDFISILPFQYITNSDNQQYSKGLRLLRLPRLYKLLKVLRLFKVLRQTDLYNKIIFMIKLNAGVVRLINMIVIMLFIAHLSSCFWYFIAKLDNFGPDCWVMRLGVIDNSNTEKYILSLYWVIQTLTTVGYGDMSVITNEERILAIIVMIGGVGFYSYTIGNLSSIFANMDSRQTKLKAKIQALNEFALNMKMDPKLYFKILEVFKRNSVASDYSYFDQNDLLAELPSALKNEILVCTHKKILETFAFFKNKPLSFVMDLLPKLTKITLSDNDILYRKKDLVEEIYFLIKGRVGFTTPEGYLFRNFACGSYFGEIELFKSKVFREETAIVMEDTQLLILKKQDLENALLLYPDIAQEMAIVAHQRNEKNKLAVNIAEKTGYKLDAQKMALLKVGTTDFKFHEFFQEKESLDSQGIDKLHKISGTQREEMLSEKDIEEKPIISPKSSITSFQDEIFNESYIYQTSTIQNNIVLNTPKSGIEGNTGQKNFFIKLDLPRKASTDSLHLKNNKLIIPNQKESEDWTKIKKKKVIMKGKVKSSDLLFSSFGFPKSPANSFGRSLSKLPSSEDGALSESSSPGENFSQEILAINLRAKENRKHQKSSDKLQKCSTFQTKIANTPGKISVNTTTNNNNIEPKTSKFFGISNPNSDGDQLNILNDNLLKFVNKMDRYNKNSATKLENITIVLNRIEIKIQKKYTKIKRYMKNI